MSNRNVCFLWENGRTRGVFVLDIGLPYHDYVRQEKSARVRGRLRSGLGRDKTIIYTLSRF